MVLTLLVLSPFIVAVLALAWWTERPAPEPVSDCGCEGRCRGKS